MEEKFKILYLIIEPLLSKNNKLNSKYKKIFSEEELTNKLEEIKKIFYWVESFSEAIFVYNNKISTSPLCPICNSLVYFNKKYFSTCNKKECVNQFISNKRKQTMKIKYGVENSGQLESNKIRMKNNNINKNRSSWNKNQNKDNNIKLKHLGKKISKIKKEKFKSGEIQIWNKGLTKENSETIKKIGNAVSKRKKNQPLTELEQKTLEKLIEVNKNRIRTSEEFEKQKQTNLKRYGVESYLSLVYQKGIEEIKNKYGVNGFAQTEEWKSNVKNIINKMKKTNLNRYGTEYVMQSSEIKQKVFESKRKNSSFNISKEENECYNKLLNIFSIVFRQYKDKERYPFQCDFYIPYLDLFIECNFHWTHYMEYFNSSTEHLKILETWTEKSKNSKYFKNAIYVWTDLDLRKKEFANKNNLNYLSFFNKLEFDNWISEINKYEINLNLKTDLTIYFDKTELLSELEFFFTQNKQYSYPQNKNKNIYYFQSNFFKKEKELFENNKEIQKNIILNRCSYLHKLPQELTALDILRGFTISGIYRGYSQFSPFWIKTFIYEFKPKTIYDPFGGWGHRLIGSINNCNYIYNDLNKETYQNTKKLYNFIYDNFQIEKKYSFFNEDSSKFIPNFKYDTIFTCPPYYNIENYNLDSFKSLSQFETWWNTCSNNFINNNVNLIGIVIGTKYKDIIKKPFKNFKKIKEIPVGNKNRRNHFYENSNSEILIIFKK